MNNRVWCDLFRDLEQPVLERTITGFNVNIDRVIPVTRELLSSLPDYKCEPAEFINRLYHSMRTCTADELVVRDDEVYNQFTGNFHGKNIIGGQAGIAAVQLASAGVSGVICIAPSLGDTSAEILLQSGITIPDRDRTAIGPDKIHLVFEHSPGIVPIDDGIIPRSNRFIVSPCHPPSATLLDEQHFRTFRIAASFCNHAFLSGYQYLSSEEEFRAAASQIEGGRVQNPDLRIHVEWVTGAAPEVTGWFIRIILPQADSVGVNEHELGLLYRNLNSSPAGQDRGRSASVMACEALEICRFTGLKRLHLHTFGYYLVVCKDPPNQEMSRDALISASRIIAATAGDVSSGFVSEGMRALDEISAVFGNEITTGIYRAGDYTLIVTPTLIVNEIGGTAGLGDRISSLAFVADPF